MDNTTYLIGSREIRCLKCFIIFKISKYEKFLDSYLLRWLILCPLGKYLPSSQIIKESQKLYCVRPIDGVTEGFYAPRTILFPLYDISVPSHPWCHPADTIPTILWSEVDPLLKYQLQVMKTVWFPGRGESGSDCPARSFVITIMAWVAVPGHQINFLFPLNVSVLFLQHELFLCRDKLCP